MKKPITTEMAQRLRMKRGLPLAPDRDYENPRVKEIAIRMAALWTELEDLDEELLGMPLTTQDSEV